MSKKTTSKRGTQVRQTVHKSRYAWCEDEILRKVIGPKIQAIHHRASSKTELCALFNEEYDANISLSILDDWLGKLGYQVQRTTTIIAPPGPVPTEELRPATIEEDQILDEPLPPGVVPTDPSGDVGRGRRGGPAGPGGPGGMNPMPGIGGLNLNG